MDWGCFAHTKHTPNVWWVEAESHSAFSGPSTGAVNGYSADSADAIPPTAHDTGACVGFASRDRPRRIDDAMLTALLGVQYSRRLSVPPY